MPAAMAAEIGGVLHGALMQLPIGRLDGEPGRAEDDREDEREQDRDRAAVVDEDRVKPRNLDAAQRSLEAIEFRTLQRPHWTRPLNHWSLTVRATGAVGRHAPPVATKGRTGALQRRSLNHLS